jgi:hypothetical protein
LRGIKCSDQIVEKRELTTVYLVVHFTLFLHIFPKYLFISVLPYSVGIVTAGPEFPSPQHFFTSACMRNISLAVILLIICTSIFGDITGTLWIRKCTWYSSVPISMKWISCRSEIPIHTSFVHRFREDIREISLNDFFKNG